MKLRRMRRVMGAMGTLSGTAVTEQMTSERRPGGDGVLTTWLLGEDIQGISPWKGQCDPLGESIPVSTGNSKEQAGAGRGQQEERKEMMSEGHGRSRSALHGPPADSGSPSETGRCWCFAQRIPMICSLWKTDRREGRRWTKGSS